ncbi:HAD family hydrolase [Polaribacter sp. Hel1_85]|uniref:HAD family hydrolase n=1 Tax=Polaribacter sp. Hel1_85 TaxID=1250005 RepID=UPI00052D3542|nr:HAD hydrolase-like protein [Polaribacter sp. Hel1_85]KGL64360.1 haloacid dehalogenase-like hydrolase [Polaribacter sp. Hel1_85]
MIKNILWDFDGVILDSMKTRDWGFREIFKLFNKEHVDKLLEYHNLNGGLSRYVKIRYFYEEILEKKITEDEVLKYAENFSLLMKEELVNPNNLILDSVNFIKNNYKNYNFHIVSGSDQNELRFLCKELNLDLFFLSIHGSPTPKKQLVNLLLKKYNYNLSNTCLIGDSINDFEAADYNSIGFYGYNNPKLFDVSVTYINSFKNFCI